jgi:TRAP-type C4-dicarboxylate transport system permease small subunit
MRLLLRGYDGIVTGMAILASAMLGILSALIVYDASLRAFRIGGAIWAADVTGLAMIYITFLGAPWLVRLKGHVCVEVFVSFGDPVMRKRIGKFVCATCTALCLYLAYRAAGVAIASIGEAEITAIEVPRWIRFAPLPVGFFFLATEFARFVFRDEAFHGAPRALD